jgi:hypothetical protein
MITTRMTKRAAGIAAVAVLFMGTAAAAAGGVLPSPFGDTGQHDTDAWRHDGAAVTSALDGTVAVSVASEAPMPAAAPATGGTLLERASLACTIRDDDDTTQSALDLAAAANAAGVTEDEFCSMVMAATSATGAEGGRG